MYEIKKGIKPKDVESKELNIAFKKNLKDTLAKMEYLDIIEVPNELNQKAFVQNIKQFVRRLINENENFNKWKFQIKTLDETGKVTVQRIDNLIKINLY